jgi:hypothetical protein
MNVFLIQPISPILISVDTKNVILRIE